MGKIKFPPIIQTHKELIEKYWDYDKNNTIKLDPNKLTQGSEKVAYWKHDAHTWARKIDKQIKSSNCAICSGHKIVSGVNSFADLHSSIAVEWHPIKNTQKANEMFPRAGTSHWWQCQVDKRHEWKATIDTRVRMRNTEKQGECPICSNRLVVAGLNSFADTQEELLKEWNYTKNTILPTEISAGSNKDVWWYCAEHNFEWCASPNTRTQGNSSCMTCINRIRWTEETYIKWVSENKPNYKIEEKYIDHSFNISHTHKECGTTFLTTPKNFVISAEGCPECNEKTQWTTEKYKKWLENNKPDYLLKEEYTSVWTSTKHQHKICGTVFSSVIHNFRETPEGCPNCSFTISKAQRDIHTYLVSQFASLEIILNDEKALKPSRFDLDIHIPSLKIGIEYDGDYWHYSDWAIKNGSLEVMKRKNNLCESIGIKLFRIRECEYNKDKGDTLQKIKNYIMENMNA